MQRASIILIIAVMLLGMGLLGMRAYNIALHPEPSLEFCKGDLEYNYKWEVRNMVKVKKVQQQDPPWKEDFLVVSDTEKECLYLADGNHCIETFGPCFYEDTKTCDSYETDITIPDTEEIDNAPINSPAVP